MSPVAVLTVEDGVEVVPVVELDGMILDRRTLEPIDLVSVVVVLGLEEIAA